MTRIEHKSSTTATKYLLRAQVLLCLLLFGPTTLAGNKYALVIGISEYDFAAQQSGVIDLQFADDDANSIAQMLLDAGYLFPGALINRDAEREEILSEIVRFRNVVEEDDFVLVYFAGHGVLDPSNNKTYLLAHDTRLGNIENRGIRLDHFMDYIGDLKAKRKLVLLDHCYSGEVEYVRRGSAAEARDLGNAFGVSLQARGIELVQPQFENLAGGEGTIVVAATGSTSELRAFEHESLGHGFFTQAILDAAQNADADLNNNGGLDVNELITYLPARVAQLTEDFLGIDQAPKIVLRNVVNMDSWEPLVPLTDVLDIAAIKEFVSELRNNSHINALTEFHTTRTLNRLEENNHNVSTLNEQFRESFERIRSLYDLSRNFPDELSVVGSMLTDVMNQIFGDG